MTQTYLHAGPAGSIRSGVPRAFSEAADAPVVARLLREYAADDARVFVLECQVLHVAREERQPPLILRLKLNLRSICEGRDAVSCSCACLPTRVASSTNLLHSQLLLEVEHLALHPHLFASQQTQLGGVCGAPASRAHDAAEGERLSYQIRDQRTAPPVVAALLGRGGQEVFAGLREERQSARRDVVYVCVCVHPLNNGGSVRPLLADRGRPGVFSHLRLARALLCQLLGSRLPKRCK